MSSRHVSSKLELPAIHLSGWQCQPGAIKLIVASWVSSALDRSKAYRVKLSETPTESSRCDTSITMYRVVYACGHCLHYGQDFFAFSRLTVDCYRWAHMHTHSFLVSRRIHCNEFPAGVNAFECENYRETHGYTARHTARTTIEQALAHSSAAAHRPLTKPN